jgi:PilZ domain-containing protein
MAAFRDSLRLPGRVLRFATLNLPSVFESIKSNQPGLVAIDAVFAQTPEGQAFVERVRRTTPQSEIRLVALVAGGWATTPLPGAAPNAASTAAPPPIDVRVSGLDARRAPRFIVLDPLQAVVENTNKAGLVDMSVGGAQVVSTPPLRPNQTLRIQLPDNGDTLRLTAHVAWSLFEKPRHVIQPYYRAGMEFADASADALRDYCKRHCAEDPIPYRAR